VRYRTVSEIDGRLGVSYGPCQRNGREALEHAEDLDVDASAAQRQAEALASRLWSPHLPDIDTYNFLLFPKMKSYTRRSFISSGASRSTSKAGPAA
jgi:hypothetical protein